MTNVQYAWEIDRKEEKKKEKKENSLVQDKQIISAFLKDYVFFWRENKNETVVREKERECTKERERERESER